MQLADDPKPAWKSMTLMILPLIATAVGARYGNWINGNTELILTLVGLGVAAYGRWRAGGVSIPGVGAREQK